MFRVNSCTHMYCDCVFISANAFYFHDLSLFIDTVCLFHFFYLHNAQCF